MGSAGNSNYAMAKAAIAAMTISIAREMGKLRRHRQLHRAARPHAHDRHDAELVDVR